MKNSLKTGLLALAIVSSFVACKGRGSATIDSVHADTTTTVTDSVKKDTSAKPDSLKKDTTVSTIKTEINTKKIENKKK